ncbi:methyl-accepting chemotaxis protein [Halomonas sp. WWR20]
MAFGVISLLLIGVLGAGLLGLQAVENTAKTALEVDAKLVSNAALVQQLALEERRYEKDTFINIGDAEKVLSYQKKWENSRQRLIDTLQTGAALSPSEKLDKLYLEAEGALQDYAEGFMTVYQQIQGGSITDTVQANKALGVYKNDIYHLEKLAEAINETAAQNLAVAERVIDKQFSSSLWTLLTFAIIALILAFVLAYTITRSIVVPLHRALEVARRVAEGDLRQEVLVTGKDETADLLQAMAEMSRSLTRLVTSLRQSSETVLTGANEIAQGSQELAARTEQQAAAIQETASSMEEMTATVRQNTESVREADTLATDASSRAQSSGEEIKRSAALMQEVAAASHRMHSIVETIDSIAFQTNILALNASVEAARAGDKGRGFAVVASEVRALASRSAESAKEIRGMLGDTRTKIDTCALQAERGGQTISETEAVIYRLASLMSEVSTATREQSSGIEQINNAITEMDSTTQQNSTLVQQSSAAASTLEEQAARLRELVAAFHVNASAELQELAISRPSGAGNKETVEFAELKRPTLRYTETA